MANVYGFGSISRRQSKKPIIAAVNGGGAYGGGTEMVLNCDYVVAGDQAKFALPEVKRGVIAVQGGECGLRSSAFLFHPLPFVRPLQVSRSKSYRPVRTRGLATPAFSLLSISCVGSHSP